MPLKNWMILKLTVGEFASLRICQKREAGTAGLDPEVAADPAVEAAAGQGHAPVPAVGRAAGPDPAVHAASPAVEAAHDPGPDQGPNPGPGARAGQNPGVSHQLTNPWKMEIELLH